MSAVLAQKWMWKADRDFQLASQVSESFSNIAAFSQLADVADVDAITEFATIFRYPNEEELDFPDQEDLQSARNFCVVTKRMVVERIGTVDAPD